MSSGKGTKHVVHSTAPDAAVVFYPFKVEGLKFYESFKNSKNPQVFMGVNRVVVTNDIVSVSTSKTKSGGGTFQIFLSTRLNYKKIINPGSWCRIFISDQKIDTNENGTASGFKMLGIVRSVRRSESIDAYGRRVVNYVIAGDDLQSMMNVPVYLNMNLLGGGGDAKASPVSWEMLQDLASKGMDGKERRLNPASVVETIISALIGPIKESVSKSEKIIQKSKATVGSPSTPLLIPAEVAKDVNGAPSPGNMFSSFMTYFLQEDLLGKTMNFPSPGGTVSVWSLIQSHSHSILNEIYTELLPVNSGGKTRLKPCFVLRSIPFSSPSPPHESCISFTKGRKGYEGIKNLNTVLNTSNNANSSSESSVLDQYLNNNSSNKSPDDFFLNERETKELKTQTAKHFFPSKVIMEHEIISINNGKSDSERFNFFFVVPCLLNSNHLGETTFLSDVLNKNKETGIAAIANIPSLHRNGLRPYITYSDYFVDTNVGIINDIVKDMWADAHLYENGSVQIVGSRRHIPVGTNIIFAERGWVAHVESVTHSFSVTPEGDKAFYTGISFSRLQKLSGQPVDLTEDDGVRAGELGEWDRGITREEFDEKNIMATNKVIDKVISRDKTRMLAKKSKRGSGNGSIA